MKCNSTQNHSKGYSDQHMEELWSQTRAPPWGGWGCWRCRSVWASGSRMPSRRICRPLGQTCGDSSSSQSASPTKERNTVWNELSVFPLTRLQITNNRDLKNQRVGFRGGSGNVVCWLQPPKSHWTFHDLYTEAEEVEFLPGTGCQRFYSKRNQTRSVGPGQSKKKSHLKTCHIINSKGCKTSVTRWYSEKKNMEPDVCK